MRTTAQSCGRQKGFTLVELMAAVAVMSIMVVSVGMLLSQSQLVVNKTEATIRANATAAAIARVLRDDLRRVDTNGFLCIADYNYGGTYWPRLMFTTGGFSPSLTSTDSATASWICYSVEPSHVPGMNYGVLVRSARLLSNASNNLYLDPNDDSWNADLSTLASYTRSYLSSTWIDSIAYARVQSDLTNVNVPPQNVTDIRTLWQVTVPNCTWVTPGNPPSISPGISIQWSDGSGAAGTNMNWFGRTAPGSATSNIGGGQNTNWSNITDSNFTEFSYNGYRALWTHHSTPHVVGTNGNDPNGGNWPRAIKFDFYIQGTALPQNFLGANAALANSQFYEVICSVGQ